MSGLLAAADFPTVAKLAQAAGGTLGVHAVLNEDGYETLFGDGCFYYLWSVHLTAAAARADIDANQRARRGAYAQWGRLHARSLRVTLAGDRLEVTVEDGDPRDRFDAADILGVLEARQGAGVQRARESLDWMVAWDARWLVSLGQELFFCFHDQAVDALLRGNTRPASVHAIAAIRDAVPGPGVSRVEWLAGRRPEAPVPAAKE